MKTIGLIGGMSWESSDVYYQQINRQIQQKLGGLHSAKIVLYSLDFQDIEHLQNTGNWEEAGKILAIIYNVVRAHTSIKMRPVRTLVSVVFALLWAMINVYNNIIIIR